MVGAGQHYPRIGENANKNAVVTAEPGDARSMLEVATGNCHMLRVVPRLVDDEPFTEILLYDSFGDVQLTLSVRGWDKESVWRGLCG